MKFSTEPFDTVHYTLGMLLHYLGKLKIQIFCRYSADMKENPAILSKFVCKPLCCVPLQM